MSSFVAFRSAAISLLRRPYSSPATHTKYNKNAALEAKSTSGGGGRPSNKGPLRGSAIPYRLVRLVDPETGKLDEPRPLRSILSTINPSSHYLELVSATPEPIVKIFDRYAEVTRAAEAAHRAREVARQNVHKEVQLTWGSAPADLAHKINKVREDLARGFRVDVVFARKRGQPKPDPAVMQERASEMVEGLLDVGRERKPRDVRPDRGLLAVFLEGTGTAESVAVDTPDTPPSQPEAAAAASSKKIPISSDCTPTDQGNVVRRVRKELAKGTRVELVVSSAKSAQETTADELHPCANKVLKEVKDVAKEWTKREYKPVSAKLSVFLEAKGPSTKGKVVVHKGPKPKKLKSQDIPDLFD